MTQIRLLRMNKYIFLSPHLDDVLLSCGGTLGQLVDAQAEVSVLTVFAGTPASADPISTFAQYQHQMWGNPQQAYLTRRAEDMVALAYFGLKPVWLDFLDCIYRGRPNQGLWYYNSDEDIFGPVHRAEFDSVRSIAGTIEKTILTIPIQGDKTQTIIYGPLTVGHHVDHQLTFLVCLQLLLQEW